MENKLGFFTKMISFGKPQLAPQLMKCGMKKALGYFVLLCLLIALLNGAINAIVIYPMGVLDELKTAVSEIIPDFELTDGKLNMAIDQPHVVERFGTIFVFENGEERILYNQYAQALDENRLQLYYISSNEIIIKDAVEERTVLVSSIPFSTTKSGVLDFISSWAWVMIAVMTIFMFAAVLVSGVVFAGIVAIISLVLKSIMKVEIGLAGLFTLSFFAITPILLLEAFMTAFSAVTGNAVGGLDLLISIAAALGIMYMYLNVIKLEDTTATEQDVHYKRDDVEQVIEGEFTEDEEPSDDKNK